MTMRKIELSAGAIEYEDSGGEGPVIVLLHGLLMDASLWEDVIADLGVDQRCVAPTLPLGAHRHPMRADADLSLRGIARLVAEFCDRLDLRDVTLVGNDTGGAQSFSWILEADELSGTDKEWILGRSTRVRASMTRACMLAGIPNYSPHDLRHRRASLWHFQGVPLREVQDRVGHADMSITGDTYTHVMIDPWDDEWAAARGPT